jgi:hypothetical protein
MSVQSAPAVQAPQVPAWQTEALPEPQGVPSGTLPVLLHLPLPPVHANVPVWHSAGGHAAPDTQAWFLPPSAPVAASFLLVVASLLLALLLLVVASLLLVTSSGAAASDVDASVLSGGVRS